jgi:hypothetical protein
MAIALISISYYWIVLPNWFIAISQTSRFFYMQLFWFGGKYMPYYDYYLGELLKDKIYINHLPKYLFGIFFIFIIAIRFTVGCWSSNSESYFSWTAYFQICWTPTSSRFIKFQPGAPLLYSSAFPCVVGSIFRTFYQNPILFWEKFCCRTFPIVFS